MRNGIASARLTQFVLSRVYTERPLTEMVTYAKIAAAKNKLSTKIVLSTAPLKAHHRTL